MTAESLRNKTVSGTVFLAARQVSINVINFLGNLMLARILFPKDFGIYSLILFMMTFFTLIGDSGLGAVIIRKGRKISEKAISTIFTFQQAMMGILSIVMLLVTFFITPLLKNPDVLWLFRVSIISYFLLSFRSVPVLILDRNLDFGKVAILEVTEVLIFQATAVTLAFMKAGVWALVCGLLAKNLAMLVVLMFISPWKMKYRFDMRRLRPILPYGLSFQGSHFVNFIKDSTVPTWIGSTLGMASLGFVTWSTTLANYPLIASNMLSRMLFPVFSRLKDSADKLKTAIEMIIRMNMLFIGLVSSLLMGLAEPVTRILYTSKWMPALLLFCLLIPVNFMQGSVTPLINAFNARGKAFYTFRMSLMWALYLWFFALIFVPKFGLAGYGIANLLMYCTNLICVIDAKKEFGVSVFRNMLPPFITFCAVSVLLRVSLKYVPATGLIYLAAYAAFGSIIYLSVIYILAGRRYVEDIKFMLRKQA